MQGGQYQPPEIPELALSSLTHLSFAYIYNYGIQHTDWKTVPFCDMSYTFRLDPWWGEHV